MDGSGMVSGFSVVKVRTSPVWIHLFVLQSNSLVPASEESRLHGEEGGGGVCRRLDA
jgi:hypothetical protein